MRRLTPARTANAQRQQPGKLAPANAKGDLHVIPVSNSAPNSMFAELAFDEQIAATQEALNANNIETVVVDTAEEAQQYVLSLLPEGAEVHMGASRTLDEIGLTDEIEASGRYQAIRPRLRALDRVTQRREFRKLASSPDVMLGSVQAVTEQGQVLVASGGGSQIGPYASGAGMVIWVVGAQKLVHTLEDGLRRLREYALPLEDERMRAATGQDTRLNQILIINGSLRPNRLKMVIVKEQLGF
jgi:LUD domain